MNKKYEKRKRHKILSYLILFYSTCSLNLTCCPFKSSDVKKCLYPRRGFSFWCSLYMLTLFIQSWFYIFVTANINFTTHLYLTFVKIAPLVLLLLKWNNMLTARHPSGPSWSRPCLPCIRRTCWVCCVEDCSDITAFMRSVRAGTVLLALHRPQERCDKPLSQWETL